MSDLSKQPPDTSQRNTDNRLGRSLRRDRELHRITMGQLAREAGVSVVTVSDLERGRPVGVEDLMTVTRAATRMMPDPSMEWLKVVQKLIEDAPPVHSCSMARCHEETIVSVVEQVQELRAEVERLRSMLNGRGGER